MFGSPGESLYEKICIFIDEIDIESLQKQKGNIDTLTKEMPF